MDDRKALLAIQEGLATFFSLLGVILSAALSARELRWCSKTKRLIGAR
jgi:hypothetical protein